MANKPFAIQGADLTLGGVNLQAGTTGVVIPGVTQAVNYFAEEVNERDGVNPETFGSNAGAITVIDHSRYLALTGTAPSGVYVPAEYSVDDLDDGAIEEIAVEVPGVFASADIANIDRGNMWATTVATPFASFLAGDWTSIPFRPKMRAGEIETVNGGGGSISIGNGTSASVDNVTEILINGTITEIESGLVGITVTGLDNSVSYKGFRAVYARMYDDEPTISKVLIYQDTVKTQVSLEVDSSTSDDLFKVSGLSNSGVIALVNIFGDNTQDPTSLSTLKQFAKSIVDNVILSNGQQGNINSTADMRSDFYSNFSNFASQAGERYQDFEFFREDWRNITSGTGGSGTGASFDIGRNSQGGAISFVNIVQNGINYQVGDIITIAGADLDGATPANNVVITVTGVGVGGIIENITYAGTLPTDAFPLDNINDGGSDQYDDANYIFTNIQGDSYDGAEGGGNYPENQWALDYNNGVVANGAAWFGVGSEYVVTYNDSIFGLFVTGANINWIATNGDSGFDGSGRADTGVIDLSDPDMLINGESAFTLNANGSVTFSDGSIQTTAYTQGDPNVWVQDFETETGSPTDIVASANSVEYLNDGSIVAVFNHFDATTPHRYNSIARFSPTGVKLWSMSFQGALYTDGWGLAVDNTNGFIYLAGKRDNDVVGEYEVATLTKLAQADGAIVWSKTYDVGYDNTNSVVDVADDGNPVVVGYAYNGSDNLIVTTKIDAANGTVIWSRSLDGQDDEEAYGMAVGNNGQVVTVGYMSRVGVNDAAATVVCEPASRPLWTLGGGIVGANYYITWTLADGVPTFTVVYDRTGGRTVGSTITTIQGSTLGGVDGDDDMVIKTDTLVPNDTDNRMVVAQYYSNGDIDWQKAVQVEEGYDCNGADADIDSNGNIYVCGSFNYDGPTPWSRAMIIIKFNSQGVKQWTRKVIGDCEDTAASIVVGPDNCLYLSAFTINNADEDYRMVIAKYNLDGTVAWSRLLDNITTWSFPGGFFFGPGGTGGSTIAVRSGYVAVVGGIGDIGSTSRWHAIVAQVSTDGTAFTVGDYDFRSVTFNGLVDTSASNITVINAGKTDSNYAGEFQSVGDFDPDFDLTSDLVGTLYRSFNNGSELRNGGEILRLNASGAVILPAGGTITEGVITSNPTIQLTPARPDVASQKLVIKGGTGFSITENGITLGWNELTFAVSDTVVIYVEANDRPNQTLYWWVSPADAGITTPDFGTVVLDNNGYNSFSFELDSDDYEFTVRVSPTNNQYDPENTGAETAVFNSAEPTFSDAHHLHLTTGDLSETSIFLGTDYHNVRTTVNGTIQINTPNISNNVWEFGNDANLTLPEDGEIKGGPGGVNKIDLSWELILVSGKTIKINPGASGVVSPTLFGFNSDASGGGIELPAGSSFDDRLDGVLISGAGLTEVNRFYPKVSNTLYEAVDAGGTYRLLNQGGNSWSLDVVGANNPQYTSNDLVTWVNTGGGSPAPTGVVSTRAADLTVGTNTWMFANDGTTTLPGAVVKSTVAKIGLDPGDIGKGRAATVTVSPSNNTNLNVGTVPGIAFGTGFTLTITVAGNGDISAVVVSSDQTQSVGDYGTILGGGALGGTTPADDIIFTVATLTDIIVPTAIDLTKSINSIGDGVYTLADGVEGQIMYLVPNIETINSVDNVFVTVAHARNGASQDIDATLYPFYYYVGLEQIVTSICTLIFTQGHWQQIGGSWGE